uniref:Protein LAZY 1-like n=1 Tax=Tanacetum cinerariifolium TaxID=118510 RepID=A0A6L2P771_TANCI|nr:protein LAZY 1-like [Tanacetum cinerariifolium]
MFANAIRDNRAHEAQSNVLSIDLNPRATCEAPSDCPHTRTMELNEQQHNPEEKDNYEHFRQSKACPESSIAHGVKEETVEMSPEFFQGFLAIGTFGSVSITEEVIIQKAVMPIKNPTEEETSSTDVELECLNKKTENLSEMDSKETKNKVECSLKKNSEMPKTNKEAKEQKAKPENLFKINATFYKKSGKLDRGAKRGTRALHLMKKMLKKLDFPSPCSATSAGGNAVISNSTERKPTKVFWKSRKIHPEAAEIYVTKSHKYEVKKMCKDEGYDKEATLEDEEKMYPTTGMFGNKPARWKKRAMD